METRVRYVVTGLFALVTLLAGILFLLWLQNAGSLRAKRDLDLHFDGPATGLRTGAPVTFNGIRIGEVTRISFDPANPGAVIARLSVQSTAPLSRDTKADLDTQGIVGNVQVALRGGTAEARLQWRGSNPPVIEAHATPSLSQEARDALAELRTLVSDNSKPVKDVIANVEAFSSALARNSGRVDGILAGLEKMTGGKQDAVRIFDLAVPSLPALPSREPVQVAIADPSSLVMYDTQKLLVADGKGEISPASLQWSDTIPKLIQRKLSQALDLAGLRYVSAGADASMPDASVQTEIRAFQIVKQPDAHADIVLALRVAGRDGKVLDAKVFSAQAPASAEDGPQAAEAMNMAFGKIVAEMAPWIAEAVAKAPSASDDPASIPDAPPPPPPPVAPKRK
jgi:phospholipid/cholesterol/gamma-HCH transport system substrate-binding protein